MRQLSLWLRAYRLPAQLNLIFPMLLGLYRHAPCDASLADLPLWEALGLSLLLQWVIMTSNEASDATTDDPRARTLISGGAGVGATGELSPRSMRRAALAGGMLGIGVTFALGGPGLVLVWLGAMLLIWAYDGPLRWSRSPVGSLCQAVGVGIVLPLLAGGLVAPLSMPTGVDCLLGVLLGFSGHILTALPDEQADRLVGKNTLVVWLGTGPARALMLVGLSTGGLLLALGFPAARCTPVAVDWVLYDGVVLAVAMLLIGLAATPCGQLPRRSLAGLAVYLWLTASASMLLWGLWISRAY
ncbi:MAG: UbiA family prenyltransferase [Rhodocyclaceae bacterium]|jgi:1,4-dihydroxy-2-naphthoate octaprenyltransferase|nr:UbiA family prenyltransferase [Rhodocyclaceae bacterium]